MIELTRGQNIDSKIKEQIRLDLHLGPRLSKKDLYSMSSEDLVKTADKYKRVKWLERDSRVYEPRTTLRNMTIEAEKVSSATNNAKLRHSSVNNLVKNKSYGRKNPVKIKLKLNVKHTKKGIDSVKRKTVTSPRKLFPMNIVNKFKGASMFTKIAIGFGTAIGVSWMANSFRGWGVFTPTSVSRIGLDSRGSAYIPEKYTRGYDTIKEATTDFGSRVRLDKVAGKVNVTPRNSTRDCLVTNTSSIIRSNLALNSYNNAIQHTRY